MVYMIIEGMTEVDITVCLVYPTTCIQEVIEMYQHLIRLITLSLPSCLGKNGRPAAERVQ